MTTKIANNAVLADGQATKAAERLMELCHEAAGMGDWYSKPWLEREGKCHCYSCVKTWSIKNPAYLTSLDAFRPIWEKMEEAQGIIMPDIPLYDAYLEILNGIMLTGVKRYPRPHHHMEALASVLTVECGACKGNGYDCERIRGDLGITCYKEGAQGTSFCLKECTWQRGDCEPCSGTGRISVLQQWTQEMERK